MSGGAARSHWRHNRTNEDILQIERQTFTIFVDNLPASMTKGWLFQIFQWTGRIADIFISKKQRKESHNPFAFVGYKTKGGALKAVKELNGMEIRGHKISVNEAKYSRRETGGTRWHQTKQWRPIGNGGYSTGVGRSYKEALSSGIKNGMGKSTPN